MPWGNDEESHLEKFLREQKNKHPMTVYCDLCPKWKASGTTEVALQKQEEHIAKKHPERVRQKKKAGKRRSAWSQAMSADRENQIDEERRQRMFVLGITEGEAGAE